MPPVRAQFLGMLALSSEFDNIAVREEELPELGAGRVGFTGVLGFTIKGSR